MRDAVDALYQKHVRTVGGRRTTDEFSVLTKALHRLERFWTEQILFIGSNQERPIGQVSLYWRIQNPGLTAGVFSLFSALPRL